MGGEIIFSIKYAHDLVLLAREEIMLQGMIDRLIEFGRCYGMEMNVEKTEVMRISRHPSPIQIMIDKINQRIWNISTIWGAGCTYEIKSGIAMAKAAFN
jgi:hypothetical protein